MGTTRKVPPTSATSGVRQSAKCRLGGYRMVLIQRPAQGWRLEAMNFELWIETQHLEELVEDFCNVLVTLQTGEAHALNVWTFAFFDAARRQGEEPASPVVADRYLLPPDLFVADLSRATLEPVVKDLIEHGTMPAHCLVLDDDRRRRTGASPNHAVVGSAGAPPNAGNGTTWTSPDLARSQG